MIYTQFILKLIIPLILAGLLLLVPQITSSEEITVTNSSHFSIEAIKQIKNDAPQKIVNISGDCTKYSDIISKYDWPVSIAIAVCNAESHGDPANVGDKNTPYVSCGLMQIRTLPGRPSCDYLKNAEANIAYAYQMWKNEGFSPWSVCKNQVKCS